MRSCPDTDIDPDCLGSVKLQWPRVASVGKEKQAKLKEANKQPKKKKKKKASSGTSGPVA